MGWAEIAAFALATALLVASPGPNGVLIARTVPTSGPAAGLANIAGFFTAFYIHGALSILGIAIILLQSATAFMIVKYLGAAYLFWIGIKSLLQAIRGEIATPGSVRPAQRKRSLWRAYVEGLLTNGLNPKVSMFYLAVFPQFIPASAHPTASAFLLVFVHSAINVIWFGAMVMLFSRLTGLARSNRVQRWLKGVTGIVFIGFGAKLASWRAAI
ncbi:LysE family translocator [Paracoccus saliphilus]|uniref:LysE family translocator n=1 Tax=Paracoccus saliphilus TaxID=405559 RepID=A0AA45W7N3_9RHOB|nr:LysE family translocator [Paracoccus saliphilus]WCR04774.1 LysE family translocator [Paracoccus saliphilus]SIT11146.1 Threonine/homoserine/homoserine lactone efflux protein [Paracoccus saliphilus]